MALTCNIHAAAAAIFSSRRGPCRNESVAKLRDRSSLHVANIAGATAAAPALARDDAVAWSVDLRTYSPVIDYRLANERAVGNIILRSGKGKRERNVLAFIFFTNTVIETVIYT